MPNGLAGTAEIADFIATRISAQTYINIMDQYHPCGRALSNRAIDRRITSKGVQAGAGCGLKSRPDSPGRPAQALDNGGVIGAANGRYSRRSVLDVRYRTSGPQRLFAAQLLLTARSGMERSLRQAPHSRQEADTQGSSCESLSQAHLSKESPWLK